MLKFSQKEKQIGKKIYRKFVALKKNSKAPLISFNDLDRILNREERELLNKVLSVNPKDYGKKYTTFYGIKPVPKNLVAIRNQQYISGKKLKQIKTQYLPQPVFKAFQRLNQAMEKDFGRRVNVVSGYRSPAYQALILFVVLFENKWNFKKTLRRLTLPDCSEHGLPKRQAIDLAPARGIGKLEKFYLTKEYNWLQKNAKKFGFHLSYPAGNKYGVMFEPWHWQFRKP